MGSLYFIDQLNIFKIVMNFSLRIVTMITIIVQMLIKPLKKLSLDLC